MNTEDILQRCLEDIAAGRKTPAQCAEQHPQVPDLLAQLRAAEALRAWPPATVSTTAAQRHQAQLRAAVARTRARNRRPALAMFPRWAMAATLAVVLVLGGAGTVRASATSVPGDALYPIKRGAEAIQTIFVPAGQQAAWHAALAETRTAELVALAADPNADQAHLQTLLGEISAETAAALAHVDAAADSQEAALLERLLGQLERLQATLAGVHDAVPVRAQAGIDQALAVTNAQRTAVLEHLALVHSRPDEHVPPGQASRTPGAPTDVPPGQAKKTATATARAATDLPPGQARQTAMATAQAATDLPPGLANKTATPTAPAATDVPPGQANKTATAQSVDATATPPGNSGGQGPEATPNCNAGNPNSPNYCTPTPDPPGGGQSGDPTAPPENTAPSADPAPTACPLNPAGNPVCNNRP